MNFDKDKFIINSFFSNLINKENNSKILGYGSPRSQGIRFKILSEIGDLYKKKILDVGCGIGDLGFFLYNHFNIDLYHGIDINEKMILLGREKYPSFNFIIGDILEIELENNSFDYVFESGIFNINIPNWESYTFRTVSKMFDICRLGIGINFLSNLCYRKNPDEKSHYVNPIDIIKFIHSNIKSRFILRHDYKDNDFTVYLYKE